MSIVATAVTPTRAWMIELRKLIDTPATIILVAVVATMAAVTGGGVAIVRDQTSFGQIAQLSLLTAPYLLAVLAILLVTAEFSHRTSLSTFVLDPRRGRVVTAKALAAATLGVAAGTLGLLAALVITPVALAVTTAEISWLIDWSRYGLFVAGLVSVCLIGWGLGLAFGNAPAAISLMLVWSLVSLVVQGVSERAAELVSWMQWDAVFALSPRADSTDLARAGVSLALWLVIPAVVGTVRLLRKEIR